MNAMNIRQLELLYNGSITLFGITFTIMTLVPILIGIAGINDKDYFSGLKEKNRIRWLIILTSISLIIFSFSCIISSINSILNNFILLVLTFSLFFLGVCLLSFEACFVGYSLHRYYSE